MDIAIVHTTIHSWHTKRVRVRAARLTVGPRGTPGELGEKVRAVYLRIHPPDDPMMDFDEHDLVGFAESSGFKNIELELRVLIRQTDAIPWDTFLRRSGNPRIPPFGEAMAQTLTPAEIEAFTQQLRPLVEHGQGVSRMASAFMRAVKP